MKRFLLRRSKDVSGVSGVGDVAEGCRFDNGKVALAWVGPWPTVTVFDSIRDVVSVHGHDGATILVWVDL